MSDTTILVVEEPDISVVVAEDPTLVVVSAPGPQGPPGPGGASGASFIHNQSNPSATWTMPHGLPYPPAVTVVESDGTEGDPARSDPIAGLTILDFDGVPVSGIAFGS